MLQRIDKVNSRGLGGVPPFPFSFNLHGGLFMSGVKRFLSEFLSDEQGLNTIEYIIAAGMIAGIVLVSILIPVDQMERAGEKVGEAIVESVSGIVR